MALAWLAGQAEANGTASASAVGTPARRQNLPAYRPEPHLLLGVAGFNFARFHLTPTGRRERTRGIGRSISRIAVPSMCWAALAAILLTDHYTAANILLLNYLVGPPGRFNDFWFVETLVYTLAALLVVLATAPVDRTERRFPFGLPLALMSLGLVTRYHLVPGVHLPSPLVAFWLFALGWATAKATTARQRVFLTLAIVITIPGFAGDLQREAVMMGGLALLVWVPMVPSTHLLNRVAGVLAGSSLYIPSSRARWRCPGHGAVGSPTRRSHLLRRLLGTGTASACGLPGRVLNPRTKVPSAQSRRRRGTLPGRMPGRTLVGSATEQRVQVDPHQGR